MECFSCRRAAASPRAVPIYFYFLYLPMYHPKPYFELCYHQSWIFGPASLLLLSRSILTAARALSITAATSDWCRLVSSLTLLLSNSLLAAYSAKTIICPSLLPIHLSAMLVIFLEEVRVVIKGQNAEGAPGPDGLPVFFYSEF